MVQSAQTVKWRELDSELEALLTEAELIRLYQPPVNILLKDDKSPIYLLITAERYPRVLSVRKRELLQQQHKGTVLGPFPSAYKLKEVLQIVRPIFPWCNLAGNSPIPAKRPCFYHHLKLCPGACTGQISEEEYKRTIDRLKAFLRGKTKEVISQLQQEMKLASNQESYEIAARARDQISLIKEVTGKEYRLKPDIVATTQIIATTQEHRLAVLTKLLSEYQHYPSSASLLRIEAYDVSNIQGQYAAVSMVTAIDGSIDSSEYKVFNIKTLETPNDYHMLQEAIQRRQNHPEWGMPQLLLIDGGKGQVRAVLRVLQWKTAIIGLAKKPDRLIIPQFAWNKWQHGELPDLSNLSWKIIPLPDDHTLTPLLKKLRDEAHRFANRQREKRSEQAFFS